MRAEAGTLAAAAVLLAAAAATLLGGPTWLRAALWALAALALGLRVARARRAGAPRGTLVERTVDPAAVAVGATLAALVLLGFALEAIDVPLATTGWTVAVVVAGAATLVLTARTRPGAGGAEDGPAGVPAAGGATHVPGGAPAAPGRRSRLLVTTTWSVLSAALAGAAFSTAVAGARATDTPPLGLSLRDLQRTSAEVVVSAPGDVGPLEVRTDAGVGSTLTYPPLSVVDGRPDSTRVLLPPKGQVRISVYNAGQAEPLRTVVVDR